MHKKYIKIINNKHLNINEYKFYHGIRMSFYIYKFVEPLILPITSTGLSDISYRSSVIRYKLLVISHQL